MIRSLRDLAAYRVHATDGDVGATVDFLIDDERWVLRYLVVDPGGATARRVLLSPVSFRDVDWSAHRFHVALTRAAVAGSPDVDTQRPVSRQHESRYYD